MTRLEPNLDHMALGPVLRERLRNQLDIEKIGDSAALDRANLGNHPDRQAIYVEFGGEFPGTDPGIMHIWHIWLIQRLDYPDWEKDYGRLRACMIAALDDWQPAVDVDSLKLLRDRSDVEDYPGLRADLTVWLLTEPRFVR